MEEPEVRVKEKKESKSKKKKEGKKKKKQKHAKEQPEEQIDVRLAIESQVIANAFNFKLGSIWTGILNSRTL